MRAVGNAPDEGEIFARQRQLAAVIGEEAREAVMRGVGLGDDQQAGRVLVDAMHDAGLLHPADAGQAIAAMGDQRIDQRAASHARSPDARRAPPACR